METRSKPRRHFDRGDCPTTAPTFAAASGNPLLGLEPPARVFGLLHDPGSCTPARTTMPRNPTPAGKQRVRTGCLTCRKRRRKCDEQKPRCANCEVKGFTCKYGSDLAFVPPRSGNAPGGRQVYGSISFVDDSPVAHAAAKSKEKSQSHDKHATESQDISLTAQGILNPSDETPYLSHSGNRTAVGLNDILASNVSIDYTQGVSTLPTALGLPGGYPGGSPISQEYLRLTRDYQHLPRRPISIISNYETDLLRHFRYSVGPWIDVGDPYCAFGVQALLLSRSNRPLQSAILALSASQRSLLGLGFPNQDISGGMRFRKEAEESLVMEAAMLRHTGQALLLLQRILPAGVQQWRDRLEPHIESDGLVTPGALAEEMGEELFWLHFRLDLASSLITCKPPLIPFRSFLQRDGSPIHTSQLALEIPTVHRVYNHALCLLGHSLALIYGDPDITSPQAAGSPELAAFPSLRQSHFLSQWTFLWTDCQKWYNERPVDAQQIVDVRGGEADQIDPDHDSSFPILIFTTPMALVANTVYHITSLLLLTHKPRLLKSLPGPRCFTSHIWHAQSIAGISASNDSPEQWDPILVASLLLIAREMTHESQQTVLLDLFRKITATMGISLERETQALQSVWNIARYDECPEVQDV
ncbi:hypothetical protein N7532_010027 [Penicillium argentinense]|uniref:Zn(2)-C6 fungal-type domain-containing protein n=1 Tax=Penicillium argentinense TaxID=1131581 RepID=A0A9W9EP47_9EURO|nr:uncharacterized protein N7532_010027 [Penicillium argentinense]KAJ5085256.1 hypothetical protein N7532_010027 [Penicillium argentinense]